MAHLRLIQGGLSLPHPPEPVALPQFAVGDLIHHRLYNYRGVIVAVDPIFQGSEEWYENVARSHPPKNHPWYEVLVDEGTHSTYVAERHLERDMTLNPVRHPLVEHFFCEFQNGKYQPIA